MQNLIQLLIRHNAIFLFIFLQILCFYLIIKFNDEQANIYNATSNAFSSWFYNVKDNTSKYFSLDDTNQKLAEDNARLFERLEESHFNNIIDSDTVDQPDYFQQYTYTSAKIVNNSTNKNNNYLTLNRGAKHGIKKHSGVLGGNGLVGIVINVSNNFATVMSVLHQQSKTSVSIKNKNYFGSLVWYGGDTREMDLEAISRDADVEEGDTIITSEFSNIFPEGIMVGEVSKVEKVDGSSFHKIKVRLTQNMNTIRYCYVVNNLLQTERLELEAELEDE